MAFDNPVIPGHYADPELHFFRGRYYLYPTFSAGIEQQTFFPCFSSSDLRDWRPEEPMLKLKDVRWSSQRCAWAPSVIERHNKFFLYFSSGDGDGIGVAVSHWPQGPYHDALRRPLVEGFPFGAAPIDAHCFLDDDGQCYLYFGGHAQAVVVGLNDDMISLASAYRLVTPSTYVEGPFMLKRQGVYYFMWSEGCWRDETYGVAYAMASSPLGPFERFGRILQSDPRLANGPGHHSVLQLPGTDDWVMAYHRRPLGISDCDHRIVCLDRLLFNQRGTIRPVVLT